jgi:hypothetical protein
MRRYERFDIKLCTKFKVPTSSFGACSQVLAAYSVGSTVSSAGPESEGGFSIFEQLERWLPFSDQFVASTAAT